MKLRAVHVCEPVLMLGKIAVHSFAIALLDPLGERARELRADYDVVDTLDGHNLIRGAAEKYLGACAKHLGEQMNFLHSMRSISRELYHRLARDAVQDSAAPWRI